MMSATPPPSSGVPQPDLTPPAPILLAVRLMYLGAMVSVVSVIVSLATYDSFKVEMAKQMRDADPKITQDLVDTAVAVGITFVVAMGVFSFFVWLWMAWKNRQGRSWARVIASVLGGLNVLFMLVGLMGGQYDSATTLLTTISLVLAAVILVLLWRKESSAFYDAVSQSHTV